MQLTVEEIINHPEFKTVIWDLPPTKRGTVAVAKDRGGPIKLVYEVHGHGPIHLVWIMGLAGFKTAWQRQTKDFGHVQTTKYSSLVFDNRGIGESEKPLLRYSTSEMARDTVELLDHIGWTDKRSVHIIGVSMGGMIAQEVGMLVPERIASLSLVSSAARLENTVGFVQNLRDRINLLIPKSLNVQIEDVKARLLSPDFIEQPDADGNFPTNGDRFAAQEINKRLDQEKFTRKGFLCQVIAAGWHHKSAAQLQHLGDSIGRDRIMVMYGTIDRMITPHHSEVLIRELGGEGSGLMVHVFKGRGHALAMEERKEHNRLIAEFVDKAESLKDKP